MGNKKSLNYYLQVAAKYLYYRVFDFLNFIWRAFFRLYGAFSKAIARPTPHYRLVMIDDAMPNILTAYRAFEFAHFLRNIQGAALYSIIDRSFKKNNFAGDFSIPDIKTFNRYKNEFINSFPVDESQVHPFLPWTSIKANLAFVVFLNNAYTLLDYLEEKNINFILELYPGGGLSLATEGEQFEKLKTVLRSRSLASVIITQKLVYNLVVDNNLCSAEKISFIYGGILAENLFHIPSKEIMFGVNKNTLDICFTANKYMARGLDKGYDIFMDMAIMLLQKADIFRFHIVGGFDEHDIAIEEKYKQYFKFYGFLKSGDFIEFYKDKDIIVSPSRPFLLNKGSLDGFPTTTCAEAGLNGLCMIVSDPLDMNVIFTTGEDIISLENDPAQFADTILKLAATPGKIAAIGAAGKHTITTKASTEGQLAHRLNLINKFIH